MIFDDQLDIYMYSVVVLSVIPWRLFIGVAYHLRGFLLKTNDINRVFMTIDDMSSMKWSFFQIRILSRLRHCVVLATRSKSELILKSDLWDYCVMLINYN